MIEAWLALLDALEIFLEENDPIGRLNNLIDLHKFIESFDVFQRLQKLADIAGIKRAHEVWFEVEDEGDAEINESQGAQLNGDIPDVFDYGEGEAVNVKSDEPLEHPH